MVTFYEKIGISMQMIILASSLPLLIALRVPPHDANGVTGTSSKAVSTDNFLNSIGANSAISSRGEKIDKTLEAIKYTGIRWIRSGYEGNAPLADYLRLHRETGVLFSYGLMSGGNDIFRLLNDGRKLSAQGAILAFEGPNEPNNWPISYQGEKGGGGMSWKAVANLQRDLYKAVKADSSLKRFPVWNTTENGAQTDNTGLQYLRIPNGASTTFPEGTQYADFANCHNYFLHSSNAVLYDNQTWNAASPGADCKVDGLYGNYGLTWKQRFKGYTEVDLMAIPRVTTETGMTIEKTRTEEKQARLYLNLFLAQFKRKWAYTALYLLRDRSDENGNQSFGFYKPDYTPRKSAVYMHNFTTILADRGNPTKLGSLSFSIMPQPTTVHELLLQNSNGKFQLVVWNEKVEGSDQVTVRLDHIARSIKVFDPVTGVEPVKQLSNVREIQLNLTDHPVIIEL